MSKIFSFGFWNTIAGVILRNRTAILILIAGITVFLGTQWKNMRFSYTEANLLPDHHEVNQEYQKFLNQFGEEGNVLLVASNDPTLFTPEYRQNRNYLLKSLAYWFG